LLLAFEFFILSSVLT